MCYFLRVIATHEINNIHKYPTPTNMPRQMYNIHSEQKNTACKVSALFDFIALQQWEECRDFAGEKNIDWLGFMAYQPL